jgi:L-erythrulose 1-phosphate isomerase
MKDKQLWIGTNWKMTKTLAEGLDYCQQVKTIKQTISSPINLFVIPPYTSLPRLKEELADSDLLLGAQNMHWEDRGAYTGEISPLMLKEIGIDLIELGHSERRQYYNENDYDINKKVHAALRHNIKPLICIGENKQQKDYQLSYEVLAQQLKVCLTGVEVDQLPNVLIAYEPVWAIGENGLPAEADYVSEIHDHLRSVLVELYGEAGQEVPLLYGGSVNTENFKGYLASKNVNGLFIGRAAWNTESFEEILTHIDTHFSSYVK